MRRQLPRIPRRRAKRVRTTVMYGGIEWWRQGYKSGRQRSRALEEYSEIVNDPSLRPKPTGKRPRRNDKRRPGKPGRRA